MADDHRNPHLPRKPAAPELHSYHALAQPDVQDVTGPLNQKLAAFFDSEIQLARDAGPHSAVYREAVAVQERVASLQHTIADAMWMIDHRAGGLDGQITRFHMAVARLRSPMLRGLAALATSDLDPRAFAERLRHILLLEDDIVWHGNSRGPSEWEAMSDEVDVQLERERCESVSSALNTLFRKPGGQGPAVEVAMFYLLRLLCGNSTLPGSYEVLTRDLEGWLRGPTAPTSNPRRPFFDLAGFARRICAAGCKRRIVERCRQDHDWNVCFHTASQPILNLVRRSAYGEVRSKVMLTAGAVLPPELTESVLQYAFVAEGLPAERAWYAGERSVAEEYGDEHCTVLHTRWERTRSGWSSDEME